MENNIPREVYEIITKIEFAGGKAYIVGGCVRDILLRKVPKDWDICTNLLPKDIKKLFPNALSVGEKHGTIGVKLGNEIYEITTFRQDGEYLDGRHPDQVYFTSSLLEDLKRRDFTINAMAYHPKERLIDPLGGLEDLKSEVIRTVGNPVDRFREDRLRILRLFRFQAVLNFDIAPSTFTATEKERAGLIDVASERIGAEMRKLLIAPYVSKSIENMKISGVLKSILPLDWRKQFDVDIFTRAPANFESRLSTLLYLGVTNKTIDEIMEIAVTFFCLSKKEREKIRTLLIWLEKNPAADSKSVKETLFYLGKENTLEYASLRKEIYPVKDSKDFSQVVNDILEAGECFTFPLAVTGKDLQEIGIPQGEKIGETLEMLLHWVWEDSRRNQYDILLEKTKKEGT